MLEQFERHSIRADAFFLVPGFILLMAEGALMVWDMFQREGGPDALQTINPLGLVLVVAGLVFALSGAVTLRRNYSSTLVVRKGHELVVHGIYRFLRHPIYLGTLLVLLGGPIATASWIALVPMSLLVPVFIYRMGVEERLLLKAFGDEYREYRAGTKRLIPFVY
jgi:protein-S-isoprenylcysteine O-methyltransferase Ste14